MSYNTGTCLKKKNAVRKILISLFISILFLSAFSVIAFAQETQTVHTEENEVKYVSSEQVNLVFELYEDKFISLPDSPNVTKSDLREALSNVIWIPRKIYLDLNINSEELISENDLFMYIDEFEKSDIKEECVEAFIVIVLIGFAIFIAILATKENIEVKDYSKNFYELKESINKVEEKITESQKLQSDKKRNR